jgi:3-dehydroquinate synthase
VDTWYGIIDTLIGMQARRDATLVALGGGVIGDVTGFAAACYMRGVRFLQAPTTLLAQVDASVGGKTGINHVRGKNLVGAFHQPAAVVVDSATLDTLAAREFNAGLAEVVKYGAIRDEPFFGWMEERADAVSARDSAALDYLIRRSVENKAEIVALDEKEAGVRALLNFGHSFGHALESVTAYQRFLHGEAVAIGMAVAARLSEARSLCKGGLADRLTALLQRLGLPVRIHRPAVEARPTPSSSTRRPWPAGSAWSCSTAPAAPGSTPARMTDHRRHAGTTGEITASCTSKTTSCCARCAAKRSSARRSGSCARPAATCPNTLRRERRQAASWACANARTGLR